MRFNCKYCQGVLFAYEENLYFGYSKAWEDYKNLGERSSLGKEQSTRRMKRLFNILFGIAMAIYFGLKLKDENQYIILPIVTVFVLLVLFFIINPARGPECKIPIEKITALTIDHDELHLEFIDAEGKEDKLDLTGFNPAKLQSLRQILLGEDSQEQMN